MTRTSTAAGFGLSGPVDGHRDKRSRFKGTADVSLGSYGHPKVSHENRTNVVCAVSVL